ncbi:AAA family ATPase [Nocardioides sp. KR10-350]
MLRRFESIKDCGIFEDFRWSVSAPDFERINLIYGSNGVGKTSLARALDRLNAESGGFTSVSIRMSSPDKANERASVQRHDDEFDRVHVFSEAYVDRSHDFKDGAEVEAVLTLGERTVEDEDRIDELKQLIDSTSEQLDATTRAAANADRALTNEYTAIRDRVVSSLRRAGGQYASNSNYSVRTVQNRFEDSHDAWKLLSDEQKDADLNTVNSDERQTVPTRSYSFSVRAGLREEATAGLATSPVSVVLDTLQDHQGASSWVDQGRHLHEGLNTCVFCGGQLTNERKTQIEQHFSDEVEAAQRSVDGLIEEVKARQESLHGLLGDGAIAGSLFDDLRDDFNAAHADATTQVRKLDEWLEGLLDALTRKRANVLLQVDYEIAGPPAVDGTGIERALTAHNERVARHASLVREATRRVELHILKESEAKVAQLVEAAERERQSKLDLETTLRDYREEVASLENVEGDPLPSAEVMARELTRILGRSELSFELLPDGKHYRVTRHGEPARDLSTGERTAITLIHFLERVKRADTTSGKPIVVIDDPVSSLDGNAFTGISTYIWSEAVSKSHIEQVFLLTHNFELFRQWDIQLGGLPGARGATNGRGFTSNCYELVAPHKTVRGTLKRVPEFMTWPPSEEARVKVRSTYHHAFITAVRAQTALREDETMEKKLDALLLYPNVLRRMLETFLAFKSPTSAGDFTKAMRDVGNTLEELGYEGDADALRLQLTRFTHSNSHAESPETDVAVSPDEIGTIIAAVFTFMNAVDPKHFEGLCAVIGVDPSSLLLQAPPVIEIPAMRKVTTSASERLSSAHVRVKTGPSAEG